MKAEINKFKNGLKFVWKKNNLDQGLVSLIQAQTNFSYPIAELLVSRGLDTKEKVFDFLFPIITISEETSLKMKDLEKAVERIELAIERQEKILIFGDYDVDGMTSSSIALLGLRHLNANVNFYLPNRFKDGYGLSPKIVELAHKNEFKLIITVDNGTTCIEAVDKAHELGLDVIITDHHKPKETIPSSLALINPHQSDCNYPFKYFCGAGVIFKLISFFFHKQGKALPDKIYELLLMGTVADVVPLTGENRYWVKFGLDRLNKNIKSFSFECLAENAKKLNKKRWYSSDIGFGIAPQLNALGRLEDPKKAVKFLVSSNQDDVLTISYALHEVNNKRKDIEAIVYADIEKKISSKEIDLEKEFLIFDASENWPPGVIGLVAGKLMHNYGRPVVLFHIDKNANLAKGSARSIAGFDLFKALGKCKELLKTFGGHTLAAGLSCEIENLNKLKASLSGLISEKFELSDLHPAILIDAEIRLKDLSDSFINDLERLEPFGNENPMPIFLLAQVTMVKAPSILKEKHIKISIFSDGKTKSIMFFNRPELFDTFIAIQDKPFDIAVQPSINDFHNTISLDLFGLDICIN